MVTIAPSPLSSLLKLQTLADLVSLVLSKARNVQDPSNVEILRSYSIVASQNADHICHTRKTIFGWKDI
jgi:hypothetical protein